MITNARNSDQKIAKLQSDISDLENYVALWDSDREDSSLEEMRVTLEELHVAEEELQLQNQELRDMQKILEKERQKYAKLFALTPEGHVLTTATGIILEANLAFLELVNFSNEFLINQPLRDLVVEGQQVLFDELLTMSVQFLSREMSLQPRVGSPIFTEVSMTPIAGKDNECLYLLWVYHDVRDKQQAINTRIENALLQDHIDAQKLHMQLEAEKTISALKSEVMKIISHEFRTPLTIIQMAASNLESHGDQLTEENRIQKYKSIYLQVKRLSDMLNDISLVVQGVGSIGSLKPLPLDLHTYCEKLIHVLSKENEQSHAIKLELVDVPETVIVDQYVLDLILRTLLHNAILYSPAGSDVQFLVSVTDNNLVFKVVDPGIGIPKDDQALIFKSIHRSTNVDARPGLGLGLKIAQECAELHGGTISFMSAENKGSTFTVTLPVFET